MATKMYVGGSYDTKQLKRNRSNSISGRLRTASDLEEIGIVNKYEKGMLKDYIISGDAELEAAIEKFETKGDVSSLRAFVDQNNDIPSMQLLDGIELGFLNVYSKGKESRFGSFDDDIKFNNADTSNINNSNLNNLTSLGYNKPIRTNSDLESTDMEDMFQSRKSFDVDLDLFNFRRSHRTSSLESLGFGSFSGLNTVFDSDLFNNTDNSNKKDFFSFTDSQFLDTNILNENNNRIPTFRKNYSNDTEEFANNMMSSTTGCYNNNGGGGGGGNIYFPNDDTATIPMSIPLSRSSHPIMIKKEKNNSINDDSINTTDINNNNELLNIPYPLVSSKPTVGPGFIGAYSPESRRQLLERFYEKKKHRVWTKKVKYDVRKNFADSRLRVKGRFVKKEDEEIMRVLLT